MTAGLNIKVDIIRNTQLADDAAGGAQITGTVVYSMVPARMNPRRPSQASLEQGLEVNRLFDLVLVGRNYAIQERDEFRVVWPLDYPEYNKDFRIMGIQPDARRRRYANLHFTLSRIERSRGEQ